MRSAAFAISACILAALVPSPAAASEIFGGIYEHDVDTFLTRSGVEDGMSFQIGWRGDRILATPLQPYAFVSAHSEGETNFAAFGLSAKFGDRVFIRPGLGLAIHTGSTANFEDPTNGEVDFGSRVLWEPELGIGARITDRMTIEASIVHLSHAQIFGRQNPGMDNIGVRLTLDLP